MPQPIGAVGAVKGDYTGLQCDWRITIWRTAIEVMQPVSAGVFLPEVITGVEAGFSALIYVVADIGLVQVWPVVFGGV